jgi:deoxyribose-phosphate aldolase
MSRIAKFIDHTILKPEATEEQVLKLCEEAKYNQLASVCVNPCRVKTVSESLKGSGVKTCVVIGFPLGANTTETKAFETTFAIEQGAEEVDMVINIGKLKDGDQAFVENDIKAVCKAASGKALVKVIIETCLLTDEEKVIACQLAVNAGAQYVKTSTGFSVSGATVPDIMLMRETVGKDVGVKASGGVRTYDAAISMLDAGASRIGTSSGVKMLDEEIHI